MKHIKHALAILAVFALLTTPVSALNLGTWTFSDDDLDNDWFTEQAVGIIPGDPPEPIVRLDIFAEALTAPLSLSNLIRTNKTTEGVISISKYVGGPMQLGEGLWGESITKESVELIMTSNFQTQMAEVSTTFLHQEYIISLGGSFSGILEPFVNEFGFPGFRGSGFDEIVISVSEVPEPGTVALLGLGLLAVAVGRKKLFK